MSEDAIKVLRGAEALRAQGVWSAVALLPAAKGAHELLSAGLNRQFSFLQSSECWGLLASASDAHKAFEVETCVAYDPFEIFWANPAEPRHSRLLEYFIQPSEKHNCGPFLLRSLLERLNTISSGAPVDEYCEVTCEKGHIDLLITRNRDDGRYAIILENKVNGASDQEQQLQKYCEQVRRRGFKREEISLCYLTLRGGEPSDDSIGDLKDRLRLARFDREIVPWLEEALSGGTDTPCGMTADMRDNLKHYLNLIKWLLNNEKAMQMNERILEALRKADEEKRLPTLGDIVALRESAQALEQSYLGLMRAKRAKTYKAVRKLLEERDKLRATHRYHDKWLPPTWNEDLPSGEYWFGYAVGDLVIVTFGEDENEDGVVFTGYVVPENEKDNDLMKRFRRFVSANSSIFSGPSNEWWYEWDKHLEIDGTHPDDVTFLADKVVHRCREVEPLIAKFKRVQEGS
jgi:PD-(D/E)XK nuclease superfamily